MKHPALTRIFAVVLAVLCLTMLLAGLGSVRSAIKENARALADYERLTDRIEEYRQISAEMEGSTPYKEANQILRKKQEEHDELASQHRMDLAVYTATRGGIHAGEIALGEAEGAFEEGKAQYDKGVAQFEEQEAAFWEGYRQFQEGKKQVAEGRKTLELAEGALAILRAQVRQGRGVAAVLESDDPNARQQITVAAYDSLLESLDSALGLYETLKAQGGISPEQVQMLLQLLSAESGVDVGPYLDGVPLEGISAETLEGLEEMVQESTGMSLSDMRAEIQAERDRVAQMDPDSPISDEDFALLQEIYARNRGWLTVVDDAIDAKLDEYEAKLAESRAQLDAAQAQIDAMEPVMEQGRAAIEQARAALDAAGLQIEAGRQGLADGRRQLNEQEAELREKEEQLRREKAELDRQSRELEEMNEAVARQKELERRETSVRLALLEQDGIRERVDQGMELIPAAEDYAAQLEREIEERFDGRLWIGGLMLLGALAGFAGIPSAFEKNKSRFWLIAPVLTCLGCAAAAEVLCRLQGRGDSYSALAAAVFALVQLALVIPQKKKAGTTA